MDIDPSIPPSGSGCLECESTGSWWVHLRRCTACGHIGCCDSSLNQHASAHFASTGHRYVCSFEPHEDWWWDYEGETGLSALHVLSPPSSRPVDQTVPGPADRVPADWGEQLSAAGRR